MLRQLFSATSRDKCIKHAQNDDKCVVNVCRCRGKCKKGKISNDAKMVSTGRTVVHISMRSDPIRADPTCHRHIKRHMAALSLALYGHSTDISNIYYVCLFVLPACVFGKWFQPAHIILQLVLEALHLSQSDISFHSQILGRDTFVFRASKTNR